MTLLEYAKQYLNLEERNQSHWALCPFHNEKTPSFTISNNKYYCFGCKSGGGLISFVMQYQNVSYQSAILELGYSNTKKNNILFVLQSWFLNSITYEQISYLKMRGFSVDDIYKYKIGYVSSSISLYLLNLGYSIEEIISTGLVYQKNGKLIDLFNKRIVFPIYDNENLVSFSGRAYKNDEKPKYINGLCTKSFKKNKVLHGYNFSSSLYTIVVEGYTDVISLAKNNIRSYATMGSLSLEQLEKIWKIDSCPILCMDGDNAGQKALKRIIQYAIPYISRHKSLKICIIENDPDYMINNNQFDFLMFKIRNSICIFDYINEKNIFVNAKNNKYAQYKIHKYVKKTETYVHDWIQETIICESLIKYSEIIDECSEYLASINFKNENLVDDIISGRVTKLKTNMLNKNNISKSVACNIIKEISELYRRKNFKYSMINQLKSDFSDNKWKKVYHMNKGHVV